MIERPGAYCREAAICLKLPNNKPFSKNITGGLPMTIEQKLAAHRRERLEDDGRLAQLPLEDVNIAQFNAHGQALRLKDPIRYAALQRQILQSFVKSQMVKGLDYGSVPKIPKPFLFKQGAEKLLSLFNYGVSIDPVREVEDFDKPFFHYVYRATVRDRSGFVLGQCEGSCNSKEKSFTSDRVDIFAAVNSIMKKAEKRAFVGAVLIATGASSFFGEPGKEPIPQATDNRPTWDIEAEVIPESSVPFITDSQRKRFWAIATNAGYKKSGVETWLRSIGISSTSKIPLEQYDVLCIQAEQPMLAEFWNTQAIPELESTVQ